MTNWGAINFTLNPFACSYRAQWCAPAHLGESIAALWLGWSLAALGRDDEAGETLLANTPPEAVAAVSEALTDGGFIAGNRVWLHIQDLSCESQGVGLFKVFLYAQLAETEAMFECFKVNLEAYAQAAGLVD